MFNFIRNGQTAFQNGCAILHPHLWLPLSKLPMPRSCPKPIKSESLGRRTQASLSLKHPSDSNAQTRSGTTATDLRCPEANKQQKTHYIHLHLFPHSSLIVEREKRSKTYASIILLDTSALSKLGWSLSSDFSPPFFVLFCFGVFWLHRVAQHGMRDLSSPTRD